MYLIEFTVNLFIVIAEDLLKDASGDEPRPQNKTQVKKWQTRSESDCQCGSVKPYHLNLQPQLEALGLDAKARVDSECIFIEYPTPAQGLDT
jgi:hypothetical protein